MRVGLTTHCDSCDRQLYQFRRKNAPASRCRHNRASFLAPLDRLRPLNAGLPRAALPDLAGLVMMVQIAAMAMGNRDERRIGLGVVAPGAVIAKELVNTVLLAKAVQVTEAGVMMGAGNQVIARVRARGALWAGAHASLFVWDKFFDFVLYPLAIINLGLLWGTATMMLASLVLCLVLLKLYDNLGSTRFRDVLGFESVKEAVEAINQSKLSRLSQTAVGGWVRLSSKIGLFLYLSVWHDPMTCTIFMRPADRYHMTGKYWIIFGLSVLVCNVVWATLVFLGIESVEALIG